MTDDLNKKITIDVEVNTDGQQQVDLYKASFDNLRSTITNLGKPIDDLSKSISSLDKDLSGFSSTGNTAKSKIADLSDSFSTWDKVVGLFSKTLGEWGTVLSIGLSVLTTFGPEVLKWISNMIKGTTTINGLTKALRDNKAVMDAMNQTLMQGKQNAQQDLVNLKLIYTATQDHNLQLKERQKAVKELQEQYPKYFGNISSEAILTGKAAKAYDDLSKALIASNRAKSAKSDIINNQQQQVENEFKISTEIAKQNELKKQQKKLQDDLNNAFKDSHISNTNSDDLSSPQNANSVTKSELDKVNSDLKNSSKTVQDLTDAKNLILKKNKTLYDFIKNTEETFGVDTLNDISNANSDLQKTINSYNKKISAKVTESKKASSAPTPPVKDSPRADPQQDPDDQTELSAPVISDAQKTSDALKQIESDRLVQQIKDDDAARAQKLAKEKQAAQQLKDFELQTAGQVSSAAFSILQNSIKQQTDAKLAALENQKNSELSNSNLTSTQKIAIEAQFKKKEDAVKLKAFKQEQEAALAQAVINGALAITKVTSQTGVLSPLVIPEIIAETAIEIAKITAEKPPAYAIGGLHYSSDGRGGVLPGYSRTDNTNAYLRSGEGIVVSEAMRAPWARNLVSAINVGFGGRDFSIANPGRGYAVGGIFTDGGNANRYYNAPVNDQKNLANTIAYQMINNFPPVYVDVKDINNQQNILAQTINRVNL
jgi:hypothetical protein